jgi:hypothetical protein
MNDEQKRDLRGTSHANRNYARWHGRAIYVITSDEPAPAPEPQRLNWTAQGDPIPPPPRPRFVPTVCPQTGDPLPPEPPPDDDADDDNEIPF